MVLFLQLDYKNELTAGTNISIVNEIVSCDLTGSTNIDITGGVISTTGLQNELTAGTNISIVGDVVSCDLSGSTNIDITGGVISATGLVTTTQLDDKYDDTGGTIDGDVDITGNLIVNSVNIITEIGTKQPTIQDGDLSIANTSGLQETLNTTLNQKYIPYNPDSFGLKAISSWTGRTASSGLWTRVVYAPELNSFIAISENTFSETMMSSTNGILSSVLW